MDEAADLAAYLPLSFKNSTERDYIAFLWDAFNSNYQSGKYEFASLAFHLLYMSFVSFSIWQIRQTREQDFRNALVGFQSESEGSILQADTPFKFYEKLKESQIFRFLKLIGCTNEHVGEFAKFVKRRNKIAHPSGTVFFNDRASLDAEIIEIMREVENIQGHMCPVVLEIYQSFLLGSANIDDREYALPEEEIEAVLVHRSYISQRDLDRCLTIDLAPFVNRPNYPGIQEIHASVLAKYGSND